MTGEPIADWAAARSDKWRRYLAGLEAMLAPLDEPLVKALALTRPMRIADIGCGAGATSVEVLRLAPEGSAVHGLDLSPALIDAARRRKGAGHPAIAFDVADMQTAPPPEPAYDRLVSRLGVMFFTDPRAAFENLRRWLVPGGRFAFAVWGPLQDNIWMSATRDSVAAATDLETLDASTPGPFRYADIPSFEALLARSGFVEMKVADWRGALPIGTSGTAAEAAQFALGSFSSFAERLATAGGDALTRATDLLAERFVPFERQGAVFVPARVHIVTGRAPGLRGDTP